MSDTVRSEVMALLGSDDLHGAVIVLLREWRERYYGDSDCAVVVVHHPGRVLPTQLVISSSACPAGAPS